MNGETRLNELTEEIMKQEVFSSQNPSYMEKEAYWAKLCSQLRARLQKEMADQVRGYDTEISRQRGNLKQILKDVQIAQREKDRLEEAAAIAEKEAKRFDIDKKRIVKEEVKKSLRRRVKLLQGLREVTRERKQYLNELITRMRHVSGHMEIALRYFKSLEKLK